MKILKKNRMDKLLDEYMKRIQAGDTKAMNEIALIFQNSYQNKEAEKWFLKAIDAGDYEYANNLGYLYATQNNSKKAEKYYIIAIKNGDLNALNNLAVLYEQNGKNEKDPICFLGRDARYGSTW